MFTVRFTYKYSNGWAYCIENGKQLLFATKAEAEALAAEASAATLGLGLNYVYEVEEVK